MKITIEGLSLPKINDALKFIAVLKEALDAEALKSGLVGEAVVDPAVNPMFTCSELTEDLNDAPLPFLDAEPKDCEEDPEEVFFNAVFEGGGLSAPIMPADQSIAPLIEEESVFIKSARNNLRMADQPATYKDLVYRISDLIKGGKITALKVKECVAFAGEENFSDFENRSKNIPSFWRHVLVALKEGVKAPRASKKKGADK